MPTPANSETMGKISCWPMLMAARLQVVQNDESKCFLHDDDDLMPLFEQEYNTLSHPLSRMSVPQSCNLASISSRATQPAPSLALSWYALNTCAYTLQVPASPVVLTMVLYLQ